MEMGFKLGSGLFVSLACLYLHNTEDGAEVLAEFSRLASPEKLSVPRARKSRNPNQPQGSRNPSPDELLEKRKSSPPNLNSSKENPEYLKPPDNT